jgi:hypothetical protein
MPIQGDVKNLYSDREKTRALFPTTKVSAVSDDNGVGLDALMENLLYSGIEAPEASSVPLNADTLQGHPASDFATPSFVTSEIAKAQLGGGSGGDIDLSGFATKDDVDNAVRAIDYPVDSVNGKTGAVQLSASDVGAAPTGYGLGETSNIGKWNGDANTLTKQGWYRLESGTVNGIGASASVRVDGYSETGLTQTAYANSGLIKQRTCTDGTWSEWIDASPSAFAPSNYGLGVKQGPAVTDCNDALLNGWYVTQNGAANAPWNSGSWLFVQSYNDKYKKQIIANEQYDGVTCQRVMNNGVWLPWEWNNPPMVPGTEYRTTERFNAYPVYVKLVDCGKGTSTGAMNMFPKIGTNIVYTDINCRAKGTSGWGALLNHLLSFAGSPANENTISLAASQDLTAYNIYLTVKYYKV